MKSELAGLDGRDQDARRKIDALGPVNAQALEEFEEAQQRQDFLNAQLTRTSPIRIETLKKQFTKSMWNLASASPKPSIQSIRISRRCSKYFLEAGLRKCV